MNDPRSPAVDVPQSPGKPRSSRVSKKRFQCNYGGCGRTYSRAEHLQRHSLNHAPKESFVCHLEWCGASFVRKDLYIRHQTRHKEQDQDNQHTTQRAGVPVVAQTSPRNHHHVGGSTMSGSPNGRPQQAQPAQTGVVMVPFGTLPTAPHPDRQYGELSFPSPVESAGHGAFAAQQQGPQPYAMPGATLEYQLNGLTPSSTEEFVTWLFDAQTSTAYQPNLSDLTAGSEQYYNDLPSVPTDLGWFDGHLTSPLNLPPQFPNNLVDPEDSLALPYKRITQAKWQQVVTLMTDKLMDTTDDPHLMNELRSSDFDDVSRPFSGTSIQSYLDAYWEHFHNHVPILHEATFFPAKSHTPLLLAVIVLGLSMLQRQPDFHGPSSEVSTRIAWTLRGHVMMHVDASPPGRLWVFQTLVLLEVHDKLLATRALHERSLVYFPTTLHLMRRSSTLFGRQVSRRPAQNRAQSRPPEVGPEMSVGFFAPKGTSSPPPEIWWEQWIVQEAVRRVAFAAFIIDTTHSVMFGHTQTLVFHEIHLFLPCDRLLWASHSPSEVGAIESTMYANGIKGLSFLDGLRSILNNQTCRTDTLGWLVLLAGLLSVISHMQQRDLLIASLQDDSTSAERWQPRLIRALDWWRKEFENHLVHLRGAKQSWQKYSLTNDNRKGMGDDLALNIVLFHLGHINISITMPELGVYAGASTMLGRPVSPFERRMVNDKIKRWASSADAAHAVYHALKLVNLILFGDAAPRVGNSGHEDSRPSATYQAAYDKLPDRSWALYFATMVLFAYGFQHDGPLDPFPGQLEYPPEPIASSLFPSRAPSPRRGGPTDDMARNDTEQNGSQSAPSIEVRAARTRDLQAYLAQMMPPSIKVSQEMESHLANLEGTRNKLVGLLSEVDTALVGANWELLDEARKRLQTAALLLKRPLNRSRAVVS